MKDCIFCKIAAREIPSDIVYEDDSVVAFKDINPKAPVHFLVIPRKHVPTLNDLGSGSGATGAPSEERPGRGVGSLAEDEALVGRVFSVARELARKFGVADQGYRIVANCGERAGQSVLHIHFHLLGGRPMSWPPG